jgi:predicted DNA-binding transcriptional regulator AlpA
LNTRTGQAGHGHAGQAANRLTRAEAAELAGVKPDTWNSYVHRGQAPAPVEYISRTPLWDRAEVEAWLSNRPGPGTRTDLQPPPSTKPDDQPPTT